MPVRRRGSRLCNALEGRGGAHRPVALRRTSMRGRDVQGPRPDRRGDQPVLRSRVPRGPRVPGAEFPGRNRGARTGRAGLKDEQPPRTPRAGLPADEPPNRLVTIPSPQTIAASPNASRIARISASAWASAGPTCPESAARWTGSRTATTALLSAIPSAWQRVPDRHPLDGRDRDPERLLDPGQRDVDDAAVERRHERAQGHARQDQPLAVDHGPTILTPGPAGREWLEPRDRSLPGRWRLGWSGGARSRPSGGSGIQPPSLPVLELLSTGESAVILAGVALRIGPALEAASPHRWRTWRRRVRRRTPHELHVVADAS